MRYHWLKIWRNQGMYSYLPQLQYHCCRRIEHIDPKKSCLGDPMMRCHHPTTSWFLNNTNLPYTTPSPRITSPSQPDLAFLVILERCIFLHRLWILLPRHMLLLSTLIIIFVVRSYESIILTDDIPDNMVLGVDVGEYLSFGWLCFSTIMKQGTHVSASCIIPLYNVLPFSWAWQSGEHYHSIHLAKFSARHRVGWSHRWRRSRLEKREQDNRSCADLGNPFDHTYNESCLHGMGSCHGKQR